MVDEVLIKMEEQPFAAGAMRECYAVKKLRWAESTTFGRSCVFGVDAFVSG
jgi:hypothetical protein